MKFLLASAALVLAASPALAQTKVGVTASDQSVSGGMVKATNVMAAEDGWLVVHKTDGMKPGPVVGHAMLKKGDNANVGVKLSEKFKKGDKLMLMIHSEKGGKKPGVFEYTLGSKLDGPIRRDGKLVMKVVTVQ
ncbi:MAG: hypothetical protein AB7F96_11745 [Beijerinckiaceae bacterium]